ncbi:MAG: MerC domain-containing protein [Bacteroidota bacterium]
MQIATPTKNRSDLFGMLASSLCMIHCLATPLIFVVQASATCSDVGPVWWRTLDYLFLIVSFFAIQQSAKTTTAAWMPKAMYGAWILLAFLIINDSFHALPLPHASIYLPALSLVVLHVYNQKYYNCEAEECCVE